MYLLVRTRYKTLLLFIFINYTAWMKFCIKQSMVSTYIYKKNWPLGVIIKYTLNFVISFILKQITCCKNPARCNTIYYVTKYCHYTKFTSDLVTTLSSFFFANSKQNLIPIYEFSNLKQCFITILSDKTVTPLDCFCLR